MHSALRDRYERRASLLSIGLLAFSIFLNAFVFVDDRTFTAVRLKPELAKVGLGVTSVIVLILSIIEFKVDWSGKGNHHREATQRLASLKAKFRQVHDATRGEDIKKNRSLDLEYEKLSKLIPAIPEKEFIRLKSKHLFKKMLSERVSRYPKAPVWFLSVQLRLEGIRQALKEERPRPDKDVT